MADTAISLETPASGEVSTAFEFQEQATPVLCSVMACTSGHEWSPIIQMAPCPGCQSPLLAIKMVNCPQCNEPSATLTIRADHLSRGSAITPLCKGSDTLAEKHTIHLQLLHSQQEQTKHQERAMPSKI